MNLFPLEHNCYIFQRYALGYEKAIVELLILRIYAMPTEIIRQSTPKIDVHRRSTGSYKICTAMLLGIPQDTVPRRCGRYSFPKLSQAWLQCASLSTLRRENRDFRDNVEPLAVQGEPLRRSNPHELMCGRRTASRRPLENQFRDTRALLY